jgi:hypothetical protein
MINKFSDQYVFQFKQSDIFNLICDKCQELKRNLVSDYLDGLIKVNDYVKRWNKINDLEQRYLNEFLPF